MMPFLIEAVRVLSQLPHMGCPPEPGPDWPNVLLDAEGVDEAFLKLNDAEQDTLRALWDRFRVLTVAQNQLQADAAQLAAELAACAVHQMPHSPVMAGDVVVRDMTVRAKLTNILRELPLTDALVLLEMARAVRDQAATTTPTEVDA